MTRSASWAAFLLLADGRLPCGSHAHSGGMEEAVASGAVSDEADLVEWLRGRLETAGRLDAAAAVAARSLAGSGCGADEWRALDREVAARTPSEAQRAAARAQGRGLLRAAQAAWPGPVLRILDEATGGAPFWSAALGASASVARIAPDQVGAIAAAAAVQGPAWAVTRLLGTDPFRVLAVLARLGPAIDAVAAEAQDAARSGAEGLPAPSAPMLEIGAERHALWEVRLFAS